MAFMTVNRVRVRTILIIPMFAVAICMIYRQARRAPGCLDLKIYRTRGLAVWTVTAWVDEASMLDFRDTGPHGRARPKKPIWFDEAAIAHWHQETADLPNTTEAATRLRELGRLSNVRFPSSAHAMGEIITS